MKVKDYFRQAFIHGIQSWTLLFKGLFYGAKRLFTLYPNPTWAVIAACIVVFSFVKIGQARSERDSYNRKTVLLQHQLDSCMQKEIRYINR